MKALVILALASLASCHSPPALREWYAAVGDFARDCGAGKMESGSLGPVALAAVSCDEPGARYDYMLKVNNVFLCVMGSPIDLTMFALNKNEVNPIFTTRSSTAARSPKRM